jgi:hypothetical protein
MFTNELTVKEVAQAKKRAEGKCKILGFHCGDYEEGRRLGCYAVWLL